MRDHKIDSLKGFAIIAVLWGHIGVLTVNVVGANSAMWDSITKVVGVIFPVYYFHIPLFFALSTIFVKQLTVPFVIKRVKYILIPFIFWYLYPHISAFYLDPLPFIKNIAMSNWFHLRSVLWFLPALFSMNIYYALYRRYSERKFVLAVFLLVSLITFLLAESIARTHHVNIPFGIDLAVYFFPYLYIMDLVYKNKEYFQKLKAWYTLLLLPLYAICVMLITNYEPLKSFTPYEMRIDLAQFTVPFTVIGFVAMTALSAVIMIFFLRIKESKTLAMVGKYSFAIYVLHLMIFAKLVPMYTSLGFQNELYYTIAVFGSLPIVIIVSIIISKILASISDYASYLGMMK